LAQSTISLVEKPPTGPTAETSIGESTLRQIPREVRDADVVADLCWREFMKSRKAIVALLVLAASIGAGVGVHRYYRWKNFGVVEEGKLYRSGQLTGTQLERMIDKLHLKTVVCLHPQFAEREREICRRKNVRFVELPMHSSGEGAPEQFGEFYALAVDPAHQPLLVHCYAGVARTGACAALYRMGKQGWSYDQAVAELKTFEKNGMMDPSLGKHIQKVYENVVAPRTAANAHANLPPQ
jgi:tyrosine-protein phosphatase SIW14